MSAPARPPVRRTWRAPFVDVEPRPRGVRPATRDGRALSGDAERLAIDLLNAVRGEVRFDAGTKALYATDASNYRQVPIGVVIPRDADDVVAAVEVCRAHEVPIVSRGGGTSLAGQTCNVAVVLDHSKDNNELLELNADERWARVRPGIVLDELRDAAEAHHLTYGPDPATHDHCTLGGMIGNNSCGVHSVMAGKTDDNVIELEVLTYRGDRFRVGPTGDDELIRICAEATPRGELYRAMRRLRDDHADEIRARFPDIPRRVSGYNLPRLLPEHGFNVAQALVGSESTLMTVLEAKVRLVDSPPGRTLVVIGYPDVYAAADDVPAVIESGCIACEGMDEKLVRDIAARNIHPDALRLLPAGHGFLLVEFGGKDRAESDEQAARFQADLERREPAAQARRYDDPADEAKLWRVREAGLGATAMVPGKPTSGPGWEDSAVAPERLGDYLRAIRTLWDRYGLDADMYGHFGQGVLHCRIDFDLVTAHGIEAFRRYMADAAQLVVSMGGSLSGEHGDGQARGELLPIMFGDRLVAAFEAFKDAWDPDGRMNPGKLVRPNPILSDLRLGADYAPPKPRTWFRYPEDEASFGHAAFRCVGVGECRRHDGGVMCPSYMVTRDERHSTRGRAHLLFELMNGGELAGGWRNDEVEEALDLCLACKGCKGDCPVNVDMATLKAEFRAHHYAGRLRPRAAYSMGLIHWWAELAARAPRLVNAIIAAPGLSSMAKLVGGIAPERTIPRFADETFRAWWRRREAAGSPPPRSAAPSIEAAAASPAASVDPVGGERRRVILWVDTFNDHFHPQVAQAAVEVLEDAGCEVVVPERPL
ncbi:MAG TPA: FAD-binding and (Fe-S)-binding domain-containing protein, partial [Candidatus Limnocylindrales bacterium]